MQQNLSFMSNKKQNEELQSRREFFKKAAKAALPVFAISILGSSLLTSCEDDPFGCGKSCSGSCSGGCQDGCDAGCGGSCDKDCYRYSW